MPPIPKSTLLALLLAAAVVSSVRAADGTGWPRVATDALGQRLEVPAEPRRIVSLTPGNTEILFALGLGGRVVGATSLCTYPEAARGVARVGGFAASTMNLEVIVGMRPDLVLAGDETQMAVIAALRAAGLRVLAVKVRGFEDLFATVATVGRLIGRDAEATGLTAALRARLEAVASAVAGLPEDARPRVYWEVFDAPLMSAGRRSMVGQLVELAGGRNIFADVAEEYPQVSAEAVIARNPEVIVVPDMNATGARTADDLRRRPGWGAVAAVRSGRVYALPADPTSRPGPRLVDGLELVLAALHPELVAPSGGGR